METEQFQKKLGIEFKNKDLAERIFIHRSYLNENRGSKLEHNERLEFLGDAVLELCVTQYLYDKYDKPEGEMTNLRSALVKGESLSTEAKRIGMNELMLTSRGEAKNTGKARDLILANAFEALIGAIYLDQGYDVVYKFIEKNVVHKLPEILEGDLWYDPKSKFQEMSQDTFGITPTYELLSDAGPDHNKIFKMSAHLEDVKVGEGEGASKQHAQSAAAKVALDKWDEIVNNPKVKRREEKE